jgi:hypothetical protein
MSDKKKFRHHVSDTPTNWKPEPSDWEPSEETIAKIKQSMQDANDGFTYTMLADEDGLEKDEDGSLSWRVQCNKCGRIGNMMEKPFPHKFDCEMLLKFGR